MSDAIKVDIWSDVQCPWCYVGKRKFEAGAEGFGGEVEVEYHSFELSPDTPVDFDTVISHELIHFAKSKGRQLEMKERLLKPYFVNGEHVGRISDPVDIAVELPKTAHPIRALQ